MASPSDALSSPTSDRSKTSATDAFKGSYQVSLVPRIQVWCAAQPRTRTGLQDWATKIRQTQNRIDAEDEAEQKRLRDVRFHAK